MAGNIVSIINFKGGVGKTTIAVNVAATLAKEHHKRTLLIDLDPQSNASVWLLGEARWREVAGSGNLRKTAYHLFQRKFDIESVIKPCDGGATEKTLPNLYLLPATYHMVKLESGIMRVCDERKVREKYRRGDEYAFLANDVELLKAEFDYVIIDCPPNLYYMTGNAVCNSDFIIVPVIPDSLSTIGLQLLLHELNAMVEPVVNAKNDFKQAPTVAGVVISKYKEVGEHKSGLNSATETFSKYREKNRLLAHAKSKVFKDQPIRDYIIHAEAVQRHLPMCLYSAKSEAHKNISALTNEFLGLMEEINAERGRP